MLTKIVEYALRYRMLVLVGLAAVIVAGVIAWEEVPVDAFPDVTPIQVSVTTESPGLAPEDIEMLLTVPVETALAGLPKVRAVRSVSMFGLSEVTVYFDDSMDIYFARQLVNEKLQDVKGRIPEGFGDPELGPNASGLGQVVWYTVKSTDRKTSEMELRTLQDWTVRTQLRTAPGVDEVVSFGGIEKQYQALIDPNSLIKYGLSFKAVTDAVEANNREVGGQYVNLGREQFLVRGLGLISNAKELGQVPLSTFEGTPVHLRDVAEIREDGGLRFGTATQDGKEVVFGMTLQRIGENARDVASAVKKKLEEVRKSLPDNISIDTVYDRTTLVDQAVETATHALFEGAILVTIILFLFLGEVRSAAVVVVALPLAMLIAFILMRQTGLSANLMSLAGLSVGIGMMVDGAVVLVENAYRLLGHSRHKDESKIQIIRRAAAEVVQPIAFAILIIIVVFLPLFTLTDIEGKMFKPMAFTITFAMAGSLVLTLTVIPVLASIILKAKPEKDTFLVAGAKRFYLPVLNASLDNKRVTVVIATLLLLGSLLLMPFLGREFLPTLQEGSFLFRITTIPSSSLEESIAVSEKAEEVVHQFPQAVTAVATIGRAERGESEDVNRTEMLVTLKDRKDWPKKESYAELSKAMQEAVEKALPTAVVSVGQPIQNRVEELVSGVRAPLALKIFGDNLATLDSLSAEIKDVVQKVKGASELSLEANKGKPQIAISVNRAAAAQYGISADEILEVVQAGVGGKAMGVVLDGIKRFDIQIWLKSEFRNDVAAIGNIPIRTSEGALLPLSRVASIKVSEGYAFIRHEDMQRNAVIQLNVEGRDVNGFVREAEAEIKKHVQMPTGYFLEWGGSFENQQRAMARLGVIVPLTIGLIFILLYTAFNSPALAGIIIANVPFAMVGGLFSLFLTGQYLSVPSAIGFIAVFGVAMLNGIVLVSFINEQIEQGKSIREAVRDGALLRLRPVLMTASVTILGLIPMLVSQGVGAETQRPLATVVVGGLITSTALTLVLLPLMYEWLYTRNTFLSGNLTDRTA